LYFYSGELLYAGKTGKTVIPSGEIIYSNVTQKPILMLFNVRNSDCSNYSQLLEDKHGKPIFKEHITIDQSWEEFVTSWSSTDYDSSSVLKTVRHHPEAMGCHILLLHHKILLSLEKLLQINSGCKYLERT